ncbi:hypothetical protein FNH22_29580 [Fulvivirga sp. M361]|uniref:hypothetical protein n=1 Tax=Fulvivirga sp. M361 TaxID=2594266 RepID=UPI001179B454|nr:hypothetical protein [Fulvivirga sp. M361]TRX48207.1 hypothetical protein FNH22_29580 [Fulvivirga sp. M361]
MAKLKNIIKQLSIKDYESIRDSLLESNADKSAYLLQAMRERQLSDTKIMNELGVNTNAYYTLRSRLNQKIEDYLIQIMESPRTDILKKVANINEIIFTKKRAIAAATLKKLEKELLDYDLSNELTIVYKSLKKMHIHDPEYYHYSQQYNRHVAYMLAVDKAEDLLAEYFKKYGEFTLSGEDSDKLGLTLLMKEMANVSALYESHRLYVYQSCIVIFHQLFVDQEESMDEDVEPIEDILHNVEKIFKSYQLDSIYYHMNLVFEFLKLEYYNHYKVYRKAERYFEEVNDAASNLLTNYTLYTHPSQFLVTKVHRHLRVGTEAEMYEENEGMFHDYEADKQDTPTYLTYVMYRAISCYYANNYEEASRWINNLLNEVSLKKYPYVQLEIKIILAIQYAMMSDFDLFNQLINSIQRQVRLLGKDTCEHVIILSKILKVAISDVKKNKADKIRTMMTKISVIDTPHFALSNLIKRDESFVQRMCERP